jgi:hypothetical protein
MALPPGGNNSLVILEALGWRDTETVVVDLWALVSAE